MNILKTLIPGLFLFFSYTLSVQAVNMGIEQAIESVALKISLDEETASGTIYGKVCDQCEELKLTITPESRAYDGNTQVGLADAKGRLGKYATVIFNKETNEVIRIQW